MEFNKFGLVMRGKTYRDPSYEARKEFIVNMEDSHDDVTIMAVKGDSIVLLGKFSYKIFILEESSLDKDICKTVMTNFLNLCIKKWSDVKIYVPSLLNKPELWDKRYYNLISTWSGFL